MSIIIFLRTSFYFSTIQQKNAIKINSMDGFWNWIFFHVCPIVRHVNCPEMVQNFCREKQKSACANCETWCPFLGDSSLCPILRYWSPMSGHLHLLFQMQKFRLFVSLCINLFLKNVLVRNKLYFCNEKFVSFELVFELSLF